MGWENTGWLMGLVAIAENTSNIINYKHHVAKSMCMYVCVRNTVEVFIYAAG